MQATPEQLAALVQLQHLDMEKNRLSKQLDELPQKQKIAAVRAKRAAIAKKRESVSGMRKDAEVKLAHALGEDADLERKQGVAQSLIDQAGGDYRSIAAHSKELEGYAKRRATLEGETSALRERLSQIAKLESEMDAASSALASKEDKLVASYRSQGGDLLNAIAARDSARGRLIAAAGQTLAAAYERVSKAKQGVALGRLKGASCSACRSTFDQSRVLALRAEAPLATCPSCGRLLIVDKKYDG